MQTVKYTIPNINCGHCVHSITIEVGELDGVESVEASSETNTATITYGGPATEEKIVALLKEINYSPA